MARYRFPVDCARCECREGVHNAHGLGIEFGAYAANNVGIGNFAIRLHREPDYNFTLFAGFHGSFGSL